MLDMIFTGAVIFGIAALVYLGTIYALERINWK